jgi:hypothetical protein
MAKKIARTGLNDAQEAFCQAFLAIGRETFGNARKAYMAAYPNSAENSAGTSGHHLLNNPKVERRLDELRTASETASTLSRRQARERLAEIVMETPDKPPTVRDQIRAIGLDSKLGGYAEPSKIELTGFQGILAGVMEATKAKGLLPDPDDKWEEDEDEDGPQP